MGIVRVNQLPEGSGSLSSDDIFLFMDDPLGSGITKKISLSEIGNAIGGGGVGNSPYTSGIGLNSINPVLNNNSATGKYSNITGGYFGLTSLYGEEARAAGKFFNAGDAQVRKFVLRTATGGDMSSVQPVVNINGTSYYRLLLNGYGTASSSSSEEQEYMSLPNDTTWHFTIKVVARQNSNGASAAYEFQRVVKTFTAAGNNGPPSIFLMPYTGDPNSLISPTIIYEDIPDWHCYLRTISRDDTAAPERRNHILDIIATVPDTSNVSVYWVAYVEAVQVITPPPQDTPPSSLTSISSSSSSPSSTSSSSSSSTSSSSSSSTSSSSE